MSTLAGMLLMYLGEEETFWALNILLTEKKFAMHGLFILGFPKLTRFLAHHDKILTKFLPKLKRHFDQCNLDSILYSLKWFFVIFCERIPFSLCLRVWDVYLLEGERVSTSMAFTVLKLHKNKLMKLKDLDSIVHFLQVQLPKNFGYDDDYVIKALEQCSEELRKAKMDLPPPPSDNEFPQRPFGVFVEPTKDEKIGHRKSGFTEIEKEVTDNVIKTQEEMAAELEKESQITEIGLGESNSQLNTVQIPESEDGGSLNLSKRSLADTSVTSTADLSIFSGGDRRPASQQHHHYEIENSLLANEKLHCSSDIDLHNFAGVGEDEENGESSPNSIAKSSSTIQIYQKKSETVKAEIASLPLNDARADNSNNSNSNDTPTPTISQQDAINPDIVRIYVPPADDMIPDKMLLYHRDRNDDEISQCSNRSSIVHVEYETLPYDKSPDHETFPNHKLSPTKSNGTYPQPKSSNKMSPGASTNNNNNNKNSPQQYYYYPHQPASTTTTTATMNSQSSSSRRGSMSRKTPSPLIESDLVIECDHMRIRKSQENVNDIDQQQQQQNSLNYSINGSTTSSNNKYIINNIIGSPIKRLTSFEELAKKSESNSLLYIHETISDNNKYPASSSKPKSDYNICYNYKNLDNPNEDLDYSSIKHQLLIKKSTSHSNNFRRNERSKHSSSENSPFDYDILKDKKKDNRFLYDDAGRLIENNNDNSIKSYDRFFNSDDEIDDEYDSRPNHRVNKKSSSNNHKYRVPPHVSGTEADEDDEKSPPNKSISNTPMSECIPLLSCDAEQTVIYQSPIPPIPIMPPNSNTSSLNKQQANRSKIPLRVGNSNSNNNSPIRKNSSISSPDSDRSDGYQTSINRYDNRIAQSMAYQSSPTSSTSSNYRSAIGTPTTNTSSSTQRSDNKIRIKIKQNI
ncbi:hypothetical protein ACKWTF_008741 [Chironomus riparius]